MGFIPTKKQWINWSLPSKLTAIGTLLGIISLLITLLVLFFGPSNDGPKNHNDDLVEIQVKESKYNQRTSIVRLTETLNDIEQKIDLIMSLNEVIGISGLEKDKILAIYSSLYSVIREGLDNPYVVTNDTMFNDWRVAKEQLDLHLSSIADLGLDGVYVLEVNAQKDTTLNRFFSQREYIEHVNDKIINSIKEFDKKILHANWRKELRAAIQ